MQIDNDLISYLEDLSCLTFSDEEKSGLIENLQKTLNGLARLSELDTNGVPESASPWDTSNENTNIFRDDDALPSFDRELILKNAPVKNEEFFIAPKTVE